MSADPKNSHLYRGVVVPMITPVNETGQIDVDGAKRIVDLLCDAKVAGIFVLGTTGESASVPAKERMKLVEVVGKHIGKRSMFYAGISGNVLSESIESAVAYKQMGAAAVVAHCPYYFALTDTEMLAYFTALADKSPLPFVLYNIPVTTHQSIAIDVVDQLRKHPNIVAIKDSAGDAQRLTDLTARLGGRKGFPLLLGSSALFTHGLKHGGVGLIPSGAHLAGKEYQQMFEAAMADDWATVERLQTETDRIVSVYVKGRGVGQGLAILKKILEERGICKRYMLPPLLSVQ